MQGANKTEAAAAPEASLSEGGPDVLLDEAVDPTASSEGIEESKWEFLIDDHYHKNMLRWTPASPTFLLMNGRRLGGKLPDGSPGKSESSLYHFLQSSV